MTEEEFKNTILSLAEELEPEIKGHEEVMSKIEDEAFMKFEKELIALKNRLVQDVTVDDDDLQARYLEEAKAVHARILDEAQKKIDEYVHALEASH